MTTKKSNDQAPAETVAVEAGPVVIRSRRQLLLKQFLPAKDWIQSNILAKPEGTRVSVARFYGIVFGVEKKDVATNDGTTGEQTVFRGAFGSTDYVSGERGEATTVIFPSGYASALAAGFAAIKRDAKTISIDVDIDMERTASGFAWVVKPHGAEGFPNALEAIEGNRDRPETAPPLPAPDASQKDVASAE